jgi:hypothetical protein
VGLARRQTRSPSLDAPTTYIGGATRRARSRRFLDAYLISDAVEAIQGGFSDGQLLLTLVAEAAIPPLVVGLYLVQRPRIARVGLVSAIAYAYSFVFFTGTVVYALVNGTADYRTLSDHLNPWMTIHGAIMVLAGLGFGFAVAKANVRPRWTGIALGGGVVLVALSQSMPEGVQLIAAGVRDVGFFGMGVALLQVSGAASENSLTAKPTGGLS